MGQVFLIAVVSALDAGLLTAAVLLLGRPRPAPQLGAYLIGGMGFSIIFGLLIVLACTDRTCGSADRPRGSSRWWRAVC
jgi:hypothetical protein